MDYSKIEKNTDRAPSKEAIPANKAAVLFKFAAPCIPLYKIDMSEALIRSPFLGGLLRLQ